ncbi:TetR/AcrR family transcriptional regulator [Solicola gregarius]|uniref:TetR family transcriptional regulator n=1 Tax=Solicola gregarius TaxID=2908642 RepID=A0AA46YMU1_9ACTN|nr:TetR family transcriptional regulator [Solicola gregarius]UYM06959.1 TetR family transcriptional regulator [Solicola gregarius]
MAGRRSGTPDTRGEIIAAAREAFASQGFDRTSLRSIARSAGVDPALIHHYFDGKDALFVAAMDLPLSPRERLAEALDVPRDQAGVAVIRTMLTVWDDEAYQPSLLGVLRSLTSGTAAGTELRTAFVEGMIFPALRQEIEGGVSERAVGLVGSQIIGLIVARYLIGVEPLVSMDSEELAQLVGPTIQRYIDL